MNARKFQARLMMVPAKINEIFFDKASFAIHPSSSEEVGPLVELKDISFSSSVAILDKEAKSVQVSVRIQNERKDGKLFDFSVSCIGIYTWQGEEFNEDAIRNIYQWGAAVQTSAIRQYIAQETAKTPYHTPWYLPIGLVQVDTI